MTRTRRSRAWVALLGGVMLATAGQSQAQIEAGMPGMAGTK